MEDYCERLARLLAPPEEAPADDGEEDKQLRKDGKWLRILPQVRLFFWSDIDSDTTS